MDCLGYDWIQKLQRYTTTTRNSFMKTLDFLEKKAREAEGEDAVAADGPPEDDPGSGEAQVDEAAQPEATAANPTAGIETPPPSIGEAGAGGAVQPSTLEPAENSGLDGRTAGREALDPESVPEPDVPASKSTA